MSNENTNIVDAEIAEEGKTPNKLTRLKANLKKNANLYTAVAMAAGGVLVGFVGIRAANKLEQKWADNPIDYEAQDDEVVIED